MGEPKFPEDIDPIRQQNDGVIVAKRERVVEDTTRLRELQEQYDAESGGLEDGGSKSHLGNSLVELRVGIAAREEEIRRYEKDPASNFLIGKIEREEIKRKIMEEMGYSARMLGLVDQHIESLRRREFQN